MEKIFNYRHTRAIRGGEYSNNFVETSLIRKAYSRPFRQGISTYPYYYNITSTKHIYNVNILFNIR
ncbi:MAG: hypothetical protein ABIJ45_11470 [Candidatus Zixiibacteriota bacterium]